MASKESKSNLDKLQEVIDIQCSEGNWNYDEFQFGLANGLILAKGIMTNSEPAYLDRPKKFLNSKLNWIMISLGFTVGSLFLAAGAIGVTKLLLM